MQKILKNADNFIPLHCKTSIFTMFYGTKCPNMGLKDHLNFYYCRYVR